MVSIVYNNIVYLKVAKTVDPHHTQKISFVTIYGD